MIRYLSAYVAAAVVFVMLDGAWLTFMGARLYRPLLDELLAPKVALAPAIAFYLIYVAGMVFLAVRPAIRDGGLSSAMLNGLVLGLVAYGTYDLTCQAVLKTWAVRLTLADMLWGGFATAVASAASLAVTRLVAR